MSNDETHTILTDDNGIDHNATGKDHYPMPEKEVDQHTSGAKLDDDKVDMSLLQLLGNAIHEVCRVMDYGKIKYTRGGFLDVPEAPMRYSAAMLRHYFLEGIEKYDAGDPFYDTELGLPFKGKIRHDAQVAVNALFRLECTIRQEEENNALIRQAEDYNERDFNHHIAE